MICYPGVQLGLVWFALSLVSLLLGFIPRLFPDMLLPLAVQDHLFLCSSRFRRLL